MLGRHPGHCLCQHTQMLLFLLTGVEQNVELGEIVVGAMIGRYGLRDPESVCFQLRVVSGLRVVLDQRDVLKSFLTGGFLKPAPPPASGPSPPYQMSAAAIEFKLLELDLGKGCSWRIRISSL